MLFKGMMPALATSTSMRPKPSTASTSAPDPASLSCSRERPASSTSVMTRRAPSLANSSAVAFPIPFAAPVTTATFSRSLSSPGAAASVTLPPPSLLRGKPSLHFDTNYTFGPRPPPVCEALSRHSGEHGQRAGLSTGWHGPPTAGVAVPLIGHRRRVADEFDGQAPWRPSINEAVSLPGLRSRQRVGAGHELHSMMAEVLHGGVQVLDVECQVLNPDVARPRKLLSLVG